ncbi:MAG: RagB/SusD family nutrient uptake outer membrane protein [Chitinophagaceae bacterium]|uniref:RagB/SusD family nutrient uptake outer membrane protein n=1 Tax=unclassified Paraflavitalea TaxID=2798305 RepID=UPI003D33A1AB|nr:RagB/SusD family nutrient uptake outer membrane protein [Chitinophagaceae bacterium]
MKRNIIASLLLGAAVMVSCNKKLDIEPRQSIDAATAIQNASDVESAVIGCYSLMGSGTLYGTSLFLDADLQAAEGYCSWRGTFQSQRQIANKTMTRDNGEANTLWTSAYQAINMANIVLANINLVTDADLKNQLEGEALFTRAIMHFELVRYFGLPWGAVAGNTQPGIVIKTTPTTTEEQAFAKAPRNTVADVYTQIITDLGAAINKLPEDNGTRADKFTALAFLSRVYLQQGNYAAARDAASAVIESGKYAMNASVRAVFDNKNTDESIWEIQQNDQNNAGTANNGMATFYASLPGIGRADVRMVAAFLNTYNVNDLRFNQWYYVGTGARPGNFYCGKWRSFSMNLPVIRIAEMYLTRAECNLRLGTTVGDTPANDLAEIRNPIRTNLNVIAAPTLADVLAERRLELAFEGVRIHDIKRLQGATGSFAWNSNLLVFPIPQREVDATGGVIVQNPGY